MTTQEGRLGRSNGNSPDGLNPHAGPQLKETKYDDISYVCPTWDQMGVFNFDLAKQIFQSGQSFDRLIALARGGLTWARDLADALKIPEISSVRIKSYKGVNESEEPRIVQPLTDSISGERILLFDEVTDKGTTIEIAQEHLREKGAQDIKIAVLCYKPWSTVRPDFFAFETTAWVIFPHEIRESIEGLIDKWKPKGLSIERIKDRLIKIGIPSDQVEFYCSLNGKSL